MNSLNIVRIAVSIMLPLLLQASVFAGYWVKQPPTYAGVRPPALMWNDTEVHTRTMSRTVTIQFIWQHEDPDNPTTDPPPLRVNTKEIATAHWWVETGIFRPNGLYDWTVSGTADCGIESTYTPSGGLTYGTIGGTSQGLQLRENVDSSSGVVTCGATLTANWTAQMGPNEDGGQGAVGGTYDAFIYEPHHHPTNFRQVGRGVPKIDGSLRFEYRWDSTSGIKAPNGIRNIDLAHIYVGEYVQYPGSANPFEAPKPPFDTSTSWVFNNPTISPSVDDRNGNAGIDEDIHHGNGNFVHPHKAGPFSFTATQKYRFHCDICMGGGQYKDLMTGLTITRRVENLTTDFENGPWEYSCHKSGDVAKRSVVWTW